VVAIANTMDLPERMQSKISSRIGNNRLVYEPYNREQILTILRSRIDDVQGVFDKSALELVSKKVSMYSGDIRRSLQITKRAVEICRDKNAKNEEAKVKSKVNYTHVLDAFEEMFNSKTVKVLMSLKKAEVIVMLALWHEL
jgi:archaeal cell division control protein 6